MDIPFVQQAIRKKKFAFASDCIRFHALSLHGGIYLDTDMYVIKPLNSLLYNQVFFGWEDPDETIISGGIIGCKPQNLFIRRIRDHYQNVNFDKNNQSQLILPRILSHLYANHKNKESINVYPNTYFYPLPYEEKENAKRFRKYINEDTLAVHLWNIGWAPFHLKLRDKILYYLKNVR